MSRAFWALGGRFETLAGVAETSLQLTLDGVTLSSHVARYVS